MQLKLWWVGLHASNLHGVWLIKIGPCIITKEKLKGAKSLLSLHHNYRKTRHRLFLQTSLKPWKSPSTCTVTHKKTYYLIISCPSKFPWQFMQHLHGTGTKNKHSSVQNDHPNADTASLVIKNVRYLLQHSCRDQCHKVENVLLPMRARIIISTLKNK